MYKMHEEFIISELILNRIKPDTLISKNKLILNDDKDHMFAEVTETISTCITLHSFIDINKEFIYVIQRN
jgi:hypothetical protein